MNWLDILLLIVMLFSLVSSFLKGFSREAIGLIATIAGLFCGLWFYGPAGSFLRPYVSSPRIANFCGFLIVFVGIVALGSVVSHLLSRALRRAGLSGLDRVLGAAFGFVRGLVMAVALVTAIVAFAPGSRNSDSPPQSVRQSRLAPYIIDTARMLSSLAPRELKQEFRRRYEQLKRMWENTSKEAVREPSGTDI